MNLLDNIRRSVLILFNSLPIVLMTTLATLAFGFGNYGMGWIFAGQVLLFPIVGLLHLVFGMIGGNIPYSDTLVIVPNHSYKQINILPSTWLVQVTYFFTYLFLNAKDLYNTDPIDKGADYALKVNNRKARTMIIMVSSVVFLLILLGARIVARSEMDRSAFVTMLSIFMSLAVGGVAANIWNTLGKQPNVGTGYLDVFGISQQMMLATKPTDQVTLCQTASL